MVDGRHHGTAGATDLIISSLTLAVIWGNIVECRGVEAGEICLSWCMIAPWRELTQVLGVASQMMEFLTLPHSGG